MLRPRFIVLDKIVTFIFYILLEYRYRLYKMYDICYNVTMLQSSKNNYSHRLCESCLHFIFGS